MPHLPVRRCSSSRSQGTLSYTSSGLGLQQPRERDPTPLSSSLPPSCVPIASSLRSHLLQIVLGFHERDVMALGSVGKPLASIPASHISSTSPHAFGFRLSTRSPFALKIRFVRINLASSNPQLICSSKISTSPQTPTTSANTHLLHDPPDLSQAPLIQSGPRISRNVSRQVKRPSREPCAHESAPKGGWEVASPRTQTDRSPSPIRTSTPVRTASGAPRWARGGSGGTHCGSARELRPSVD